MNRYSYEELLEKATAPEATAKDRLNLFDWFERYDMDDWNGECFKIDNSRDLYPVYQPVGEPDEDGDYDEYELIDAEIR